MVLTSHIDYEALFDTSPNPYVVLSPSLTLIAANQAYLRVTGMPREALVGRNLFDVFPGSADGENARLLRESLERVIAKREPDAIALIHYPIPGESADGVPTQKDRFWSAVHTPILDERGAVTQIVQCTVDVTELLWTHNETVRLGEGRATALPLEQVRTGVLRRAQVVQEVNQALEAERRSMRQLFEQAPGFVAVVRGPDHVFEIANRAYFQLIGNRDIIGRPVREALPEVAGQGFYELLDQVYATGEPFIGRAMPVKLQAHAGAAVIVRHLDFIYQPIIESNGTVTGIFVQGYDVSDAHELAQEMSYQAAHDSLTGLPNRREFERRLKRAIGDTQTAGNEHTLLYLDLDQFKVVNDTCGHAAGDELLRQVSALLAEHTRASDTLARLGGDEFAVLLEHCSLASARGIADTLRQLIAGIEFSWGPRTFGGSVSIGVITFGGNGPGLEDILSAADSACFLAKEKGRNRVHVYHPDDSELSARLREMNWISRLRQALDEERLVLYAQNIVPLDSVSGDLGRREVLVRLREADGTIVPPMAFIPAAERYDLMPTLDRYIIRASFRHFAALPELERTTSSYSINVSGATLNDEAFLPFVERQIAVHALSAHRICFEITETAAIANLTRTARVIRALKGFGFQFALDDFGSGMSSFSYLKHLPVDFIKIDGEFITGILDDLVDRAVVQSITNIAHAMGIKTVAEYVDNDAVLSLLGSLGVDYAQGYGIHNPAPLEA